MRHLDTVASTIRDGQQVDEIEFAGPDGQPARAYLVHSPAGDGSRLAVAVHDERGDKATHLDELLRVAPNGFVGLSIDAPAARRAARGRDPLRALKDLTAMARTALVAVGDELEPTRVALLGQGIGGEVAAKIAKERRDVNLVIAVDVLPQRSRFVASSDHPLAVGIRRSLGDRLTQTSATLREYDLADSIGARDQSHWLVQTADDDDRLDQADQNILIRSIPAAVRVQRFATRADLRAQGARDERRSYITRLG